MKINFIVIKNSDVFDMSELVISIVWQGRRGSAARSITVNLLDDYGYGHTRSYIKVEEGHQCIFSIDGTELFRGMIMKQAYTNKKTMSITAYDNGIYLSNNKDTFTYKNITASEVFKDCCKRFGMPYSDVADTKYKIAELTKPNTTAWDIVSDALSQTYSANGIRYYVMSDKGNLKLIRRRENIVQWVIENGQNLINYSYSNSIENIKTRIKILSKEGDVVSQKINSDIEKKIGVFQDIGKPDEDAEKAKSVELAANLLKEKGNPNQNFTVEAMGIAEVYSGVGVFIIIKEIGMSRTFYVEEDTHTFSDNKHIMKLKLSFATDIKELE